MSAQPILLTPESAPSSRLACLTPSQQSVAAALASGSSISAAAASAGVHRATIHNWLKSAPAFTEALQQAKAYYAESLKDQLRDLSKLALDNLQALLTDPNCPYSVRLRASLAVLNRPTFPDSGWTLPVSISPDEDYFANQLRAVEREIKVRRQLDQLDPTGEESTNLSARLTPPTTDSTLFDTSTEPVELSNPAVAQTKPSIHQTPRNAACPCGSGQKYKRCCGKTAPAVLCS